MKRLLSLLTAAALLAALAACGQSTGARPTAPVRAQSLAAGTPETGTAVFPRHAPYGAGVGAQPGRVVWAHDPDSVDWNGEGYWWEPEHFDGAVMQRMVDDGIASLAGAEDAASGWDALFRAHNASHGGQGGYRSGQRIAIKVNMNGSGAYDDDTGGNTRESYTNPVLLRALLVSLVAEAGVAPGDITVYDAGRVIPDYLRELCGQTPLEGVRFRYRDIAGPNDAQPDRDVPVVWSEEVSGDTNYLPTCVTEADYLINFANLKGHVYGLTLTAKNHFGSIMNSNRMRAPEAAGVHRYLTQNRMDAYTVLVDLMVNYQLGEKTMLYLLDAIICAPGESVSITGENSRWQQSPFNGDYTSSLFLSQDGVAIDSVGADFLMNEPTVTSRNSALRENPNVENYLHEAGLVADAPSGTAYYNGNGRRVANLGVHEHWNNPTDKQYSRNLGGSEGIELVRVGGETSGSPAGQSHYTDVPDGAWYADAVYFCREQGLMNGTSETTFSPEMTISRSQLTAILWRQAGSPAAAGAPFPDVPAGAYYATAAAWANAQGIVTGYSDGRFAPDDPVTRAQLATILWRADGHPVVSSPAAFADQGSIPPYAVSAAAWAQSEGIINGRDGNLFDPDGSASRAQVAAILYRYLNSGAGNTPAAETTLTTNGGEEIPLSELTHRVDSAGVPTVYYISDITPEALTEVYEAMGWTPSGKVAVKLSTGEPPASNYLSPDLIKDLVQSVGGTIVECNTAYGGSRANTVMHYQVAEDHGFTAIAPVQILDENGSMTLPVNGGTVLTENYVGAAFNDYDSYLVLSHFKGHSMSGFGGAIKNISFGLGSSEGKGHIHSGGTGGSIWGGEQDAFLEAMGDAGKSVVDALNGRIAYVNVMNRLSVDCDCDGNPAEPDMHDIGILASTDPVALDQACIDLIYAARDSDSLQNRIESRNGIHTLENAEAIGLGSRTYTLVNIGSF